MSIVALAVVAAIILVVLAVAIPRMRGRQRPRQRERVLPRRGSVAAERLEETEVRAERPRPAEQRAALAEGEALRDRVEAHLQDGRSQRSARPANTEGERVARQTSEQPVEPRPVAYHAPVLEVVDPAYGVADRGYGGGDPRYGAVDSGHGVVDPAYGVAERGYGGGDPRYGAVDPAYGPADAGTGRPRPAAWPVSHGVELRLQEVAARLGTERVPAAPSPARAPRIHGGPRVRRGRRGQETASAGADRGDDRL